MRQQSNQYTIAFLAYENMLRLESNPRLMTYYHYCMVHGQNPIFLFVKGFYKSEYRTVQGKRPPFIPIFSRYLLLLSFILRSKSLNHLYVYSPSFLFAPILLLARLRGINIVKERTEVDSLKPSKSIKDVVMRLMYTLDERKAKSQKHVVITPQIAQQLELQNYHVMPPFIYPMLYNVPPKRETEFDDFRIGYFGSFGAKDGVARLMEAVNDLDLPDVSLKLLGSPSKEARRLKNRKWNYPVEWVSEVQLKEVIPLLHDCDLLVCNRDDSPYSAMGFPSKILEYLLSNVHILCADTGNVREVLGDSEVVFFPPSDQEALKSALKNRIEEQRNHYLPADHTCTVNDLLFKRVSRDWYNFVFGAPQ